MEYNFRQIEEKWQQRWKESNAYKVSNDSAKPKCYVLDMFPYPSGAGLHVGHPLGYIASDIYARYKRLKGFNVLHPMGYDSFGLPAEQYALETGQHPAATTEKNIDTFRSQLDKIGFCFDWSRQVKTSDPNYYKWTQWIFLQLFNSYFCSTEKKALPISKLIQKYETKGAMPANGDPVPGKHFTAEQWKAFSKKEQEDILMKRRLAFSAYGEVNWCEALGTVLANDEVVNGVSERGGHPVIKKQMRQWYLRITAYADRLLEGLETVDFSESMKEMQRNWIGKSSGAEITFRLTPSSPSLLHGVEKGAAKTESKIDATEKIAGTSSSKENIVSNELSHPSLPLASGTDEGRGVRVYTTRPDTIFGVDFMVVAPELGIVKEITTPEQQTAVDEYLLYVKSRSERERMSEVKQITGCFTGAYALNPFDGRKIPVWIAEYVLAGYGTGAIMAVPCGDQRDYAFAKHFNIPITNIIGGAYNGEEANATKDAILQNSGFINGMKMKDAIDVVIDKLEEMGIGKRKVNYRMRDAGFSRQRYWGEPFPIVWKDGIAYPLDEKELPLELPHVEKYGPGPEGEGPLANITEWVNLNDGGKRETSTMPGYAGSSWYFLRYMDPHNDQTFCDRKASDYWNQVDLYVGGTEHAVGHLLYSRMWTKVLYDLDLIGYDEPYKKLLNQGMIQGSSRFVYRISFNLDLKEFLSRDNIDSPDALSKQDIYVSKSIYDSIKDDDTKIYRVFQKFAEKGVNDFFIRNLEDVEPILSALRVDVNIVDGDKLNIKEFVKNYREENPPVFVLENEQYYVYGQDYSDIINEYICGVETEKMSKSKYNTVNPNDLVEKFGADTFRMYEMFLGPVEASKPWDTKGIEGVHRFLRKLWRLFFDELKGKVWNEDQPSDGELKVLHKTIKKIDSDTETFAYNTAVSAFMVCVNELNDLKCHKKAILEQLVVLLTPYAPHACEELWSELGNSGSVLDAAYPVFDPKYLVESEKEYPISVNGKLRTTISIATNLEQPEVEKIVLGNDVVQKWLEGKAPKKIIFVKNKMINVVI